MNDTVWAAIGGAVLSLLGKIVFDWLKGKNHADSIRDIVNDALESKFLPIMENQNRVLAEVVGLQQKINDAIIRLVTLQEARGRFH